MKRILSLVLVCMMVLSVAAVASAEDVTLRMAVGYNNANTGLAFSAAWPSAPILPAKASPWPMATLTIPAI